MLLNIRYISLMKKILLASLVFLLIGCESINMAREEAERDQFIIRHVKHALYKNEIVPKSGRHFGVASRKGVVTLTGVADDIAQMNDAVAIAKRSQGVTDVINEITVKSSGKIIE